MIRYERNFNRFPYKCFNFFQFKLWYYIHAIKKNVDIEFSAHGGSLESSSAGHAHNKTIGKANNLKVSESKETKGHKQESQKSDMITYP